MLIHITSYYLKSSYNNNEYFFKAFVATPRLQLRVPLAGPEVDAREPAGFGRQQLHGPADRDVVVADAPVAEVVRGQGWPMFFLTFSLTSG